MATKLFKKEFNTDLVINQMSLQSAFVDEKFDMSSYPNELFLLEDYSLDTYYIDNAYKIELPLLIETLPFLQKANNNNNNNNNKFEFQIYCVIIIDENVENADILSSIPLYNSKFIDDDDTELTSLSMDNDNKNANDNANSDIETLKAGCTYLMRYIRSIENNKIKVTASFQQIGGGSSSCDFDYDIISPEFDDIGILQ